MAGRLDLANAVSSLRSRSILQILVTLEFLRLQSTTQIIPHAGENGPESFI